MSEKQLEMENGFLRYKVEKERAVVTGYQGFGVNLALPARIEGYPVAAIERKAFLSCKSLCGISVPCCVEEVGDWAFAYCGSLKEISFPRRQIRFGRAVFKDCKSLERITVREASGAELTEGSESRKGKPASGEGTESFGRLLAAAVTMLDAPYLLDTFGAGGKAWLEQWDTSLLSLLGAADSEGYITQSVYGEEDYIGMELEEFESGKRKRKVRLAFLRLLHPQGLSLSLRKRLEQYLRSLTKGQGTEEAWQVIREEKSVCREYYSLFAELGCVTEDNFPGILADIGEESPEMKAFFLKFREGQRGEGEDFFQGLEL